MILTLYQEKIHLMNVAFNRNRTSKMWQHIWSHGQGKSINLEDLPIMEETKTVDFKDIFLLNILFQLLHWW